MKTLYISDLDGTLLNTEDRISQKSLTIINGLIEKGMHFTYATARSLVSARKAAKGLRTDIPVIVYNGAFIMDAQDGKILYFCAFSDEERRYVKRLLGECGIHPLVYSFIEGEEKVSWNENYVNEGIQRYIDNRAGDHRMNPLPEEESLYDGEVFYYTCIGEKEDLLPVYERLKEDERYTCTLQQELYRPEYWCEIMPKKATKAEAMKQLQKIWDCGKIISFGDAINDIPMFRQSEEAYAVDNAVPLLKEEATGIIAGNDEDGVAAWLLEHFAEEKENILVRL